MWVTRIIDDEGAEHLLGGRQLRVVNAVLAHGEAVDRAGRGTIRISWSNGETKVVVETHYAAEHEPARGGGTN